MLAGGNRAPRANTDLTDLRGVRAAPPRTSAWRIPRSASCRMHSRPVPERSASSSTVRRSIPTSSQAAYEAGSATNASWHAREQN